MTRKIHRWTALVWLAALLLQASAMLTAAERPNILLIVADDLGYSDLGCYGGEIRTPHLDSLASGGLRLTRFYNTGRCCPSRASILTGYYPHRVGLGHMTQDIGQPGYRGRLAPEAGTIAEVLAPAGYRSFISGKWHLGTADPTRHGFEEFFGTLTSAKTFWDPEHYLRLPNGRMPRRYAEGEFYGTDAVTDHAIDFLSIASRTPERPWFLYLAFHAPHFPLQAPREEIEKYASTYQVGWDVIRQQRLERMKDLGVVSRETQLPPRSPWWDYGELKTGVNPAWSELPSDRRADLARRMAIFAAMVDRLDQNVGRVVERLRASGQLESTLIVFLSDNGACAEWDPRGFDVTSSNQNILHRGDRLEQMGQSGSYHSVGSGWANASNTPWRMYKHFAHEGGINSPCIVHWPDGLRVVDNGDDRPDGTGRIERQPAHIIDLLPTFADLAGVSPAGPWPLPGTSLRPLLTGERLPSRRLFFEHEGHRAVHDGDWKLVALKWRPWELYRVSDDRTESDDLASRFPQRVSELSAAWDEWAAANQVTPLPLDLGVKYLKPHPADGTSSSESSAK